VLVQRIHLLLPLISQPRSKNEKPIGDIGIPANSQYQLLQLIVQLDEDVLNDAEREGTPLQSKVMLAHATLSHLGEVALQIYS